MRGEVKRVIRDLGLVLIQAENGEQFSFRHSSLREGDFATLAKGDLVEFNLTFEQSDVQITNIRLTRLGVEH